jgi:dUTP pyrophosphatase
VRRLDPEVPLPGYARPGDAGCDLVTTIDAAVPPGERLVLPTGIAIELPDGYAAFVHPRSGLAVHHGVGLVNGPGTIDAGYRGEIKVILINHDTRETLHLRRLDRVAQLVVQRVEQVVWRETSELSDTERGAGGHGSTGGYSAGGT